MRIALLSNRDLHGNIGVNLLCDALAGHEVALFLSEKVGNAQPAVSELRVLGALEQGLPSTVVWPLAEAAGRPSEARYLTFRQIAEELGGPCEVLPHPNSPESLGRMRRFAPDLAISLRYGRVLKDDFLAIPRLGVLNLHSGRLPHYRGILATLFFLPAPALPFHNLSTVSLTEPGRLHILGAMGEPAWKMPPGENEEPDGDLGFPLLERVVEHPDGSLEIRHVPLTVKDFMNPLYGDKWLQGFAHQKFTIELCSIVTGHFASQPDVVVTSDVQYLFGPGLSKPAPDVGVLRDVSDRKLIQESADIPEAGRPCLLIEVVSPKNPRIRNADEKRKVRLYQRVGVPEYFLVRPPRDEDSGEPVRLWGYRLGPDGRYQPVEPDGEGRLRSETTGLAFAVSPGGDQVHVFDVATGERLLGPAEVREAYEAEKRARETAEKRAAHAMASRRAANEKAAREAEARRAAEEELARLRAELERYRKGSGS